MGFNIWLIWKGRNQIVFQDKSNPLEKIWQHTQKLIKETILAEAWEQEDQKTTPEEGQILTSLNLKQSMVYPQKQKNNQSNHIQSQNKLKFPHEDFIKLNFVGASKGNLGLAGFRGISKDIQGQTKWVYANSGGIMSNNEVELMTHYEGIRIAIPNGYAKLEIEGDSNLAIEMLRKLNNGKNWEQVAKSWRMAKLIQDLEEIIKCIDYRIINHVKRDCNKATDFLANQGCNEQNEKVDSIWLIHLEATQWEPHNLIITHDNHETTTSG